jgi:Na+/melibiose symporter-like transporter
METSPRVMTRWQLLCFSLLSAPLAMVNFAVVSFVPTFYAVDLGVGLATVGAVFLFGRAFDIVTDPLVGALSDRTQSRWGPRVPWMVVGFPGLLLFVWLLLSPPDGVGALYLFCVASAYLLFLTFFDVSYSSIGLEISPNAHERSVIAGTKGIFQIIGAVLASVASAVFAGQMGMSLQMTGVIFVGMMPIALALFWWRTPRQPRPPAEARPNLWRTWLDCMKNRAFRGLMLAFFAVQAANAMTVGLFVLFATHVLQAPDLVGPMFLALLLATALFVPVWVILSKKIGKQQSWIAAIVLCCPVVLAAYLVGAGDTVLVLMISFGLGACMTCDGVMPTSLLADIVAAEEQRQGHSQAASYLALKNVASKMAFVALMGVAFPVLGWAGFDRDAGSAPETMGVLLLFFAAVPCGLRLLVAGFLWRGTARDRAEVAI